MNETWMKRLAILIVLSIILTPFFICNTVFRVYEVGYYSDRGVMHEDYHDERFIFYYLYRYYSAHDYRPNNSGTGMMTQLNIADKKGGYTVKNLSYRLSNGIWDIPVKEYRLSAINEDDYVKASSPEDMYALSRIKDWNSIQVIIENVYFFNRTLTLEYTVVLADRNGREYTVQFNGTLRRKLYDSYIDF
jgi:hypothetical protein